MRKHPCDYYDVMCSQPESDCLENCPREAMLFPPWGKAYDSLMEARWCNPYRRNGVLGCEGCPDMDECLIEH